MCNKVDRVGWYRWNKNKKKQTLKSQNFMPKKFRRHPDIIPKEEKCGKAGRKWK